MAILCLTNIDFIVITVVIVIFVIIFSMNIVLVGLMHAQIVPLWASLEVVDDSPLYTPKQYPVLPIDKSSKKVEQCV